MWEPDEDVRVGDHLWVSGGIYNLFIVDDREQPGTQAFIYFSPPEDGYLEEVADEVYALGDGVPNTLQEGDEVEITWQDAEGNPGRLDVTLDVFRQNVSVATFSFITDNLCVSGCPSAEETTTAPDDASGLPIDGQWDGFWVSSSPESAGYLYEVTMTLVSGANNSVDEQIARILRGSPRASEQAKIGLSAVEFVRGSYDPVSRVIRLEGYEKTDPNTVISLDRYHLLLADNGTVIGGITEGQGTWQGSLSTLKVP